MAILKYSLEKRLIENQLIEDGHAGPIPDVDIKQIAAQGATLPPDSTLYRKADPLTGVLKVQLLGCQDILLSLPQGVSRGSIDSGLDSASTASSTSSKSAGRILKGGSKDKKERKSSEAKDYEKSSGI